MTTQRNIDPDAGERTPDRDQRIRTLRFTHGDADLAVSLWQQFTTDDTPRRSRDDERGGFPIGRMEGSGL